MRAQTSRLLITVSLLVFAYPAVSAELGGVTYNANQTFFGNNTWNAGDITLNSANITIDSAGQVVYSTSGNRQLIGTGQLINQGTFLHTFTGGTDNITVAGNTAIVNDTTGTFTFTNNGDMALTGANAQFINRGILSKTGGTGDPTFLFGAGSIHIESGQVLGQSGLLSFVPDDTSLNTSNAAATWTADGGDIQIGGVWSGTVNGSAINGGRIRIFDNGNGTAGPTDDLRVGPGGLVLNVSGGGVTWTNENVLTQGETLTNQGVFTAALVGTNSLQGAGTFRNEGTFTLTSGAIQNTSVALDLISGSFTIDNGGQYNFAGGSVNLIGTDLVNNGTFVFANSTTPATPNNGLIVSGTNSIINNGDFNITASGNRDNLILSATLTIQNNAGGTVNFTGGGDIQFTADATINNAGLFLKSGSDGNDPSFVYNVSSLTGTFNNLAGGEVRSDAGEIHIAVGGTSSAASLWTANGGNIQLAGDWSGTFNGSGAGQVIIGDSGNGVILSDFTVNPGGVTFNLTGGGLNWNGAVIETLGNTFANTGNMTISGAGHTLASSAPGGQLVNTGSIDWQSGSVTINAGATFSNPVGGTLIASTGATKTIAGPGEFSHQGTIQITGGELVNAGNFLWTQGEIQASGGNFRNAAAGTLTVRQGGVKQLIDGSLINQGTFNFEGGAITLVTGGTVTNSGVMNLGGQGTTRFDGNGIVTNNATVNWLDDDFTLTPGVQFVNSAGATFNFNSAENVDLTGGGTFTNNGLFNQMATGNDNLRLAGGTTFVNNGTFRFTADGELDFAGGSVFHNTSTGVFEKTVDTGDITLVLRDGVFIQEGIIRVTDGTMAFGTTGNNISTASAQWLPNGGEIMLAGTWSGTIAGGGTNEIRITDNASSATVDTLTLGGNLTLNVNGAGVRWDEQTIDTNGFTLTNEGLFKVTTGDVKTLTGGGVFNNVGTYDHRDGTITLAGGASIVNNGTMLIGAGPSTPGYDGTGTVTNFGTVTWNDGDFSLDPGVEFINSGVVNYTGDNTGLIGGGTFTNAVGGIFNHNQTNNAADNFQITDSTFNNQGTFHFADNNDMELLGSAVFNNTGLFLKDVDGGDFTYVFRDGSFVNGPGGIVRATAGDLGFSTTGANSSSATAQWQATGGDIYIGGQWSGTIAGTATGSNFVRIRDNDNNTAGANDSLIVGPGGLTFNIGGNGVLWDEVNVDTAAGNLVNQGTFTFSGGAAKQLTGGGTFDNQGTYNFPNGTLTLVGGSTFQNSGQLNLSTGSDKTFAGTGTVRNANTGTIDWTGGDLVVGTNVQFFNEGTINYTGQPGENDSIRGGGTFSNTGVFAMFQQDDSDDNLIIDGMTFNNAGTFEFHDNHDLQLANGGSFVNTGLLVKRTEAVGGDPTFVFSNGAFVNNGGTIRSEDGQLAMASEGANQSTGGAWQAAGGDILVSGQWSGDITGTSTGSSFIRITDNGNGGVIDVLSAGPGGLTLNVTGNGIAWDQVNINTNGSTITNNGLMTLVGGGGATPRFEGGGTFINNGTFNHQVSGGNDNLTGFSGQFINNGLYDFQGEGDFDIDGAYTFTNSATGVVRRSAASSNETLFFSFSANGAGTLDNQGTIESLGGEIEIRTSATAGGFADLTLVQWDGGTRTLTGGTWIANSTAGPAAIIDIQPANAGILTIGANAEVQLIGSGSNIPQLINTVNRVEGRLITQNFNLNRSTADVVVDDAGAGSGSGFFQQTGGTNSFNSLTIADNNAGTYELNGSGFINVNDDLIVGGGGTGVFDQNGGTVLVGGTVGVGNGPTGNGTYNINGGALAGAGGSSLTLLDIGGGVGGATGTVNLNAGGFDADQIDINTNGTLNVAFDIATGDVINLLGGTTNTQSIQVSPSGVVNLVDGVANNNGSLLVQGTVNQTGATANVRDDLSIASGGQYLLLGGRVDFGDTLTGNPPSLLSVNAGGTFDFDGGTLQDVTTIAPGSGSFQQDSGNFIIGREAVGPAAVTTINGGFNQLGGSLDVDIFGLMDSEIDQLVVNGDVFLDGQVVGTLGPGVDANGFDAYTVLISNTGVIDLGANFSTPGFINRLVQLPGGALGLQLLTPEPNSVVVWILLGLGGYFVTKRRQNGKKSL